jgi:hypothetical protein
MPLRVALVEAVWKLPPVELASRSRPDESAWEPNAIG